MSQQLQTHMLEAELHPDSWEQADAEARGPWEDYIPTAGLPPLRKSTIWEFMNTIGSCH